MTRTVIIDGDVVAYRVGAALQEEFEIESQEDDEFIYRTVAWCPKQAAIEKLESKIDSICKDTKSQEIAVALSSDTNFRKTINPNYKGNRKGILKPVILNFLKDYLANNYKTYIKPDLEADDVIGILATSNIIKGDKVVWSMDKDFKTIPCKFRREAPDGSHKSYVYSLEEADWWFMYQTLIGDKVDGYEGCKGIGDKTARKILGDVGSKTLAEMWDDVVTVYISKGYTEEDALLNARMARILRADDYDFKNKEVKLWSLKYEG